MPGPATQVVDPGVYTRLSTSQAALERSDDPEEGPLGVFEPVTHERFVVEEVEVIKLGEDNHHDAL